MLKLDSFDSAMRKFFKFKKGVVPIAIILMVLLASTAIVFYVVRNQTRSKATSPTQSSTDSSGLSFDRTSVNINMQQYLDLGYALSITTINSTSFTISKFTMSNPNIKLGMILNHPDVTDPVVGTPYVTGNNETSLLYLKSTGGPLTLLPLGSYTGVIAFKDSSGIQTSDIPITVNVISKDTDNDGFTDSLEEWVQTSNVSACGQQAWPPDFNNDHKITSADILAVSQKVGTNQTRYDLNGDGKVDTADVGIVQALYGKSCQ